MAKIPFDIKYKPQIESGEYKVVIYMGNNPTEECPVEILKWDCDSEVGCIVGYFRVKGKCQLYFFDANGEHKVSGIQGNRLFIITPEPELPSNLDEAADEYASTWIYGSAWNDAVKNTFKAGVKWMAEQGETLEGEVVKDINNKLAVSAKGLSGTEAKFGDKVIVQVRRK